MSDVTVRWPTPAQAEQHLREETFENVRLELLAAGGSVLGYVLKGKGFQVTIPFIRIEMLTEHFEHDPRDDDLPDRSPERLTLVPK